MWRVVPSGTHSLGRWLIGKYTPCFYGTCKETAIFELTFSFVGSSGVDTSLMATTAACSEHVTEVKHTLEEMYAEGVNLHIRNVAEAPPKE